MRAIQITEHGGPEVLIPTELPDPTPGAGELLVEVAAAGVNYIDTYQRQGIYPMTLPYVPGMEGAGRVRAVGDGVTEFAVGDRVAWAEPLGSYAELAVVPGRAGGRGAGRACPTRPPSGAMLQGMTAHFLVHDALPGAARRGRAGARGGRRGRAAAHPARVPGSGPG